MKKLKMALAAGAACLLMSAAVGTSLAYFTDYASASGSRTIAVKGDTTITEEYSDWTKSISVSNAEDAASVWVRARFYADESVEMSPAEGSSAKWQAAGDGWYYYSDRLAGGEATESLQMKITNGGDLSAQMIAGDRFDVVAVYESTPALESAESAQAADWALATENIAAEAVQ